MNHRHVAQGLAGSTDLAEWTSPHQKVPPASWTPVIHALTPLESLSQPYAKPSHPALHKRLRRAPHVYRSKAVRPSPETQVE